MATPNTSISQLGLSDVNVELNFPAATGRRFNDAIFRSLTGVQGKTAPNTSILISDVSDKAAMDGILAPSSNSVSNYGTVVARINLSVDSDMVNADVFWSYQVISGGGNIVLQPDGGKNATLTLISDTPGTATANVEVTANVSFQGHQVGSDVRYFNLTSTVFNPNLQVNGTLTVNNSGFVAQTAVTQITATSNVVGGVIEFSTSPPFGGVVSGNTITFSSTAGQIGIDNNNIYTLTTVVRSNNVIVASNTVIVNTRAAFLAPDLDISVPATTNNVFANSGPITSSLRVTATHGVAGANVVWSATKVSGDDAVLLVVANNAYANLTANVVTFGAKKSVYDVRAVLQYSNGYVLNQKTQRLTLRAVGYGLTFTPASDFTSQGYGAQTATSTASATYLAGTLTWDTARLSGATASVTPNIGANSASLTLTVNANTPGSITSVNRVNPVISFDGIIVANVSSITTVSAQFAPFTFSLGGPTSNTQVGDAPVTSSVLTIATHTVPNGYVVWSVNSANVTISSNTSTANLFINTSTLNTQGAQLNAMLYDEFNRFVAEDVRTITLRGYAPNITFTGANTASVSGYAPPMTANVSIEARALTGANSFSMSAAKIGGDNLIVGEFAGNTTYDRTNVSAIVNTAGTVSGQYRLTATATYFGVSFSKTFDVAASASLINPNYTLTPANSTIASYNSPVTANGQATASYSLPGGSIQWSTSVLSGSVLDVPVANSTIYRFRTQRSTIGSTNTTVAVTGTLLDSAGLVVSSLTVNTFGTATVSNPNLVISGATTSTVGNTFQATASVTLTASVDAAVVGETFQISTTRVSGPVANVVIGADNATITLVANGTELLQSSYDVTFNVVLNGQIIASDTRRVSLKAEAFAPTINFASSNNIVGNFNYPVEAAGVVTASSTPASNVQFSVSKLSGSDLTTQVLSNQVNLTTSQSAVGIIDGTYRVIASYFTPVTGHFITSREAIVRVAAERYNPGFSWSYNQGATVERRGWEEDISAISTVQASTNAALTGATFDISGVLIAGPGSYAKDSNSATITLNHNRTTHGANTTRESVWDVTCSVVRDNQTLAGPFTRRVTVRTVPYFLSLVPLNAVGTSTGFGASTFTILSSNHEAFTGTNITWNTSLISGTGVINFTTSNSAGTNNQLNGFMSRPTLAGVTRTATHSVTANFFANGANRSISGTLQLTATNDDAPGPIN
jgi:hypothetical protein